MPKGKTVITNPNKCRCGDPACEGLHQFNESMFLMIKELFLRETQKYMSEKGFDSSSDLGHRVQLAAADALLSFASNAYYFNQGLASRAVDQVLTTIENLSESLGAVDAAGHPVASTLQGGHN